MRIKKSSLLFLFFSAKQFVMAQTAADVFNTKEITWLGIDYSHIKIKGPMVNAGPSGFVDAVDLRDHYFEKWNNMVISEPARFNLFKAFRVENCQNQVAMINKKNQMMNADDMLTEKGGYGLLNDSLIKKIVSEYDLNGKAGIGCIFIMECLDKKKEMGVMWVTFIDMHANTVLFSERLAARATGIGLKNHWISPVGIALNQIAYNKYSVWKNKYVH